VNAGFASCLLLFSIIFGVFSEKHENNEKSESKALFRQNIMSSLRNMEKVTYFYVFLKKH